MTNETMSREQAGPKLYCEPCAGVGCIYPARTRGPVDCPDCGGKGYTYAALTSPAQAPTYADPATSDDPIQAVLDVLDKVATFVGVPAASDLRVAVKVLVDRINAQPAQAGVPDAIPAQIDNRHPDSLASKLYPVPQTHERSFAEGWNACRAAMLSAGAQSNRLLDSSAQQCGVPEGWGLAPIDPTDDMILAALKLQGDDAFIAKAPAVLSAMRKIFIAMMKAAPPAAKAVEVDDAMVKRALAADYFGATVEQWIESGGPKEVANFRHMMRAALRAALGQSQEGGA